MMALLERVLHILVESILQVTIGPFLHGVIIQDYFAYYTSQYLFARTIAEVVIILLKLLKPDTWHVPLVMLSLMTCICSFTDGLCGLGIGDTFVMRKMYFVNNHTSVLFILSYSYELFIRILYNLSILRSTKVTSLQWISVLFCRTSYWIIGSACCLFALTFKTWIVPYLFLAGQSPVTLTQSENSWSIQQPSNLKYDKEFQQTFLRAIGEDVHLTCRTDTPLHASNQELIWTINGSEVSVDSHHLLSFRFSKKKYILQLVIRHIQAKDFGIYRCIQKKRPDILEQCSWTGENYCLSDLGTDEILVRSLILKQFPEELKHITARVGTVFNMPNFLSYHIVKDSNFELLHTVNGINHSDVCSNLRHVSVHIPTQHQIDYSRPSCKFIRGVFICNISFSVCVNSFGLHEFTLVKQGHFKNAQVHHPQRFLIKPEYMIMSMNSNYVFYDKLLTILYASKKTSDAESRNLTLQLIQAKEIMEFRKSEVLSTFIRMVLCIMLNLCFTFLECFFDKLTFNAVYLFEKDKYRLGLPAEKKSKDAIDYDIFVSFCDAERDFVFDVLIPFLENELGLRVCQPDIDITPGHPLWTEYSEKISKSKKIIVVLSPDYLQDPFCNQMQFSMLIVPMLCTSDKALQDLFLLEIEACEIPAFYSNLLPYCEWYTHCDEDKLKIQITNWMKLTEPSVYNIFSRISFKVAMLTEQFV